MAALVKHKQDSSAIIPANDNYIEKDNPFTAEAAGGLMGQITKWILETSRRKSPELAVMASLGFMSALYGRRAITPTGCGLNAYFAGIAPSGYGKEAPLQRTALLLSSAAMSFLLGPGEVSSASAMEKVLRKKPVMVMPWDEMGDILEGMNAKNAGWAASVRTAMLQLYSKSNGVWLAKETTDENRNADPIYFPTMSVIGTSTPVRFYGGLTQENLADGFMGRIIVVAPKSRPERARHMSDDGLEAPGELLEAIKDAADAFPWKDATAPGKWRDAHVRPNLTKICWASPAAEDAWLAIEDWQYEQIDEDATRDGIVGRVAENAIKLATLRALSLNPQNPSVSVNDVAWARAIMMESIAAVDDGIEQHMHGTAFEAVMAAILRHLGSSPTGEMFKSRLLERRGIRGVSDQIIDDAIRRLRDIGKISADGKTLRLCCTDKTTS